MPENKLVPLLDAIWRNEKRNNSDFDKVLTREVKESVENVELSDGNSPHKLDGFHAYPNLYVVGKDLSCE